MDISELKAWCDEVRGRRSEAAQALGISKQVVTDWLAGRRHPTEEQILAIKDFLDTPEPQPMTAEEIARIETILSQLQFEAVERTPSPYSLPPDLS